MAVVTINVVKHRGRHRPYKDQFFCHCRCGWKARAADRITADAKCGNHVLADLPETTLWLS